LAPLRFGELKRNYSALETGGAERIALAYVDRLPIAAQLLVSTRPRSLVCLISASAEPPRRTHARGVPILSPAQARDVGGDLDAILVVDGPKWPESVRNLEVLADGDRLLLPATADWVVPRSVRELTPANAWLEDVPAEYAARSGLRGHYLEFGTFWGRSFFPAYFRLRHYLAGKFFAFDSFQGLSKPQARETEYTGGDFREHTYRFNLRSFHALADLLRIPSDRLVTVPGYYGESLARYDRDEAGLAPKSVSVCVIDCDLVEPTRQVLEWVTDLIEPGGLLYFDDWRLCRADRTVGERAAALQWLGEHPDVELVELHRDHWQHQWFIFHR